MASGSRSDSTAQVIIRCLKILPTQDDGRTAGRSTPRPARSYTGRVILAARLFLARVGRGRRAPRQRHSAIISGAKGGKGGALMRIVLRIIAKTSKVVLSSYGRAADRAANPTNYLSESRLCGPIVVTEIRSGSLC